MTHMLTLAYQVTKVSNFTTNLSYIHSAPVEVAKLCQYHQK